MYKVLEDCELTKYFQSMNIAKNKTKAYVKLGFIEVNGMVVKKLPLGLKSGDVVIIKKNDAINYGIKII